MQGSMQYAALALLGLALVAGSSVALFGLGEAGRGVSAALAEARVEGVYLVVKVTVYNQTGDYVTISAVVLLGGGGSKIVFGDGGLEDGLASATDPFTPVRLGPGESVTLELVHQLSGAPPPEPWLVLVRYSGPGGSGEAAAAAR